LTANAEVATVPGSIPASSNTVESEWAADEVMLNSVRIQKKKKSPVYSYSKTVQKLKKNSGKFYQTIAFLENIMKFIKINTNFENI
jgi:hypothetical protein